MKASNFSCHKLKNKWQQKLSLIIAGFQVATEKVIFSVCEQMLNHLSKISETVRSCVCLRVNGEGVTMLRNRDDFSMSHSAY